MGLHNFHKGLTGLIIAAFLPFFRPFSLSAAKKKILFRVQRGQVGGGMTHCSPPGKQNTRSSLTTLKKLRHADGGARRISAFEVLIIFSLFNRQYDTMITVCNTQTV